MKKDQKWIMFLVGILGGLAGGILSAGLMRKHLIEAENFQVVDKAGNARAILGWSQSFDARSLSLKNKEGQALVVLSITEDAKPALTFMGKGEEKYRMILGLLADGTPGFYLTDANAEPRFAVKLSENGSCVLSFFGTTERIRLGVSENDKAELVFFDNNDVPRAAMQIDVDAKPKLGLLDSSGKTIWSAPYEIPHTQPSLE